ncbi:MAG TPA: hypothetical protein VMZ30_17560 [Pyrinomonadaceae bacterium]|nr:hypothetical protein [Pyrinomonadaceae bacterium]
MYCSTCGVAVTQGLSYCNYCGAKVSGAKGDTVIQSSDVKPELLVCAMTGLFILGLLVITVLIGVIKTTLDLPVERVLALALLPFLLLLLIEGVLIRLLLRRKRGAEAVDTGALRGPATKELDAAQARALPQSVPSVTEHTTRAFAPVYTERTSK